MKLVKRQYRGMTVEQMKQAIHEEPDVPILLISPYTSHCEMMASDRHCYGNAVSRIIHSKRRLKIASKKSWMLRTPAEAVAVGHCYPDPMGYIGDYM